METKGESDVSLASSRLFAEGDLKDLDLFSGLTVGQIVGPGLGERLPLRVSLREAAAALADTGRTAVAVSDGYGGLAGIFTENDVIRAYFEEAAPDHPVAEWLSCGLARAPAKVLQRLSVSPTATLAEVADRMIQNALAGDLACHHVLVEEDPDAIDGRCAVLSPLEMLQAFCRAELWQRSTMSRDTCASSSSGDIACLKDAEMRPPSSAVVGDLMKSKDSVFTCLPGETIKDVLRTLLMAQQNSVLVVDDEGIYGIFTPRDATRAYAEAVPASTTLGDWIRRLNIGVNSRIIAETASIGEAAALMTARGVNHLVVVPPGGAQALGVVSSFDLALAAAGGGVRAPAALRALRSGAPRDAGPTVGELVRQQWHLPAVCNRGATLAEVATLLAQTGRTSMAVALGGDSPPLGLLTETDIVRAYLDGWARDFTVEKWLLIQESSRPALLPHLVVPPSVRITEAAALMLGATRPGQDSCHHLVVKGPGFGWDGVFSALDVARALCGIDSGLEVARTGADQLRVSMVMKTLECVPRCRPGDSLKDAFTLLLRSHQGAVLVAAEEHGVHKGLVTPRCALQAFADGTPHTCTVAEWLRRQQGAAPNQPREVHPDVPLLEAAMTMTERCVHHLLVKANGSSPAVGVISSLDLARGIAAVRCHAPLASLGWLAASRGPNAASLWAH